MHPLLVLSFWNSETGHENYGGGDDFVTQLKNALESEGFLCFAAGAAGAGPQWELEVQTAIEDCQAFVPICSTSYGQSDWKYLEASMAFHENKPIVPVWLSGPWPPKRLKILLSGTKPVGSRVGAAGSTGPLLQQHLLCGDGAVAAEGGEHPLPAGMLEDCARQLVLRLRAAGCEGSRHAPHCQAATAGAMSSEAIPGDGAELAAAPAPVSTAQSEPRAVLLSPKEPPPLVMPLQQQPLEPGDQRGEGGRGAAAAAPAPPAAVAPASSPQPPSSPPLPSPLPAQSPPTQLQVHMQGILPVAPAGAAASAADGTAARAADSQAAVVCSIARAGSSSAALRACGITTGDVQVKDVQPGACSAAASDQLVNRTLSPELEDGMADGSDTYDALETQHQQHEPADSAVHTSVPGHPPGFAAGAPEDSSVAVATAAPSALGTVAAMLGPAAAAAREGGDVEVAAAGCDILGVTTTSHDGSSLAHVAQVPAPDDAQEAAAAKALDAAPATATSTSTAEVADIAVIAPMVCAEMGATAPAGSSGAAGCDRAAGLAEQVEAQQQRQPSGASVVDTGASSLEAADVEAIGWLGGAHVPGVLSARRGDWGPPQCEDGLGAYHRYALADRGTETGTDGSVRGSAGTAGVGGSLELGDDAIAKDGGDEGLPHPQSATQQLHHPQKLEGSKSSTSSSYADAVEGSAVASDAGSTQLGDLHCASNGAEETAIAFDSRCTVGGGAAAAGGRRWDASDVVEAAAQQPDLHQVAQQPYHLDGCGIQMQRELVAAAEAETGTPPLLPHHALDGGSADADTPAASEVLEALEAQASSSPPAAPPPPPVLLREPSLRAQRQGDFMAAARAGDMSRLMELLQQERFLDVNAREPGTRNTPLHYAARCGDRVAVEALLRAGAFASSRNKDHATPLHWAVSNRHTAAALCLIHWRADVTAADHDFYTPLHWAALNGDVTTASALLAAGASPTASAAGVRKETPLSLARSNAHAAMAGLLQQHAAAAATVPMGRASSSNLGMAGTSTSTHGADDGAALLLRAPAAIAHTTAAALGVGAASGPGSSGASPAFVSTTCTPFAPLSSVVRGAYPVIPLVDNEVVGAMVAADGAVQQGTNRDAAPLQAGAAEAAPRPLAPPAPEWEEAPSAPPVTHAAGCGACTPPAAAVAAEGIRESGGGEGSSLALSQQHPHLLHPQPDLMPLAWGSVASAAAAAGGARGLHAPQHAHKDSMDAPANSSASAAGVSHSSGVMPRNAEATAAAPPIALLAHAASGGRAAPSAAPVATTPSAQPRWVDPPPPPPFPELAPQPLMKHQPQPAPVASTSFPPPLPPPTAAAAAAQQAAAPSFWTTPQASDTMPRTGVAGSGNAAGDMGALPWAAAGTAGAALGAGAQVLTAADNRGHAAAGRQQQVAGRCLAAKLADTLEERELLRACQDGNVAAAQRLLTDPTISTTISPNCFNEMRRTPLHLACGASGASGELVAALVAAGADVNAVDAGGHSPLIEAAWFGRAEVVRALLRAGAVLDARCKAKGRQAVHWAARNGNRAALKVLLESGADMGAKDKSGMFGSGRTPLDLARAGGCQDCVQLLKEWGAR